MTKPTREEALSMFNRLNKVHESPPGAAPYVSDLNEEHRWSMGELLDLHAACGAFREPIPTVCEMAQQVAADHADTPEIDYTETIKAISEIPAVAAHLGEHTSTVRAVAELAADYEAIIDAASRAGWSSVETVQEFIARRAEASNSKVEAAADSVLRGINDAADEHGRRVGETVVEFVGRMAAELGVAEGNLEIAHASHQSVTDEACENARSSIWNDLGAFIASHEAPRIKKGQVGQ